MQNFNPEKALQSLVKKYSSNPEDEPHQQIIKKLDEVLFYLNMVKNGSTVSTGEYEALTRLFSGQLMYVDTRDASIAPHLMMEGTWEPGITGLWQKLIKPDSVVFDLGANFGYFAVLAGAAIEKHGVQLHLFEPNPDLHGLLEKTLSVNGLAPHARIVGKAVGKEAGTLKLNRIKNLWGSTTAHSLEELKKYRMVEDEFDAHFTVPIVSVDEYCLEHNINRIDVMKIDVEGFEDAVYQGMLKTLKKQKDLTVLLEFTFGAYKKPEAFFNKIMTDFAYCYAVLDDGSLQKLDDYKHAKSISDSEWLMIAASRNPVAA